MFHSARGAAVTATLLMLAVAPWASQTTWSMKTTAYGPQGQVDVARPRLAWCFEPSQGEVTETGMTVNGRRVPALYDARRGVLEYVPEAPLPAGEHQVAAYALVDGKARFERKWTAKVSSEAISQIPVPNPAEAKAQALVNALRRKMDLPPVQVDPTLSYAAARHAEYLRRNNRGGHFQQPGEPGFSGATLQDRLNRVGYIGPALETVTCGVQEVGPAVQATFDAPYHRLAFMQPGASSFGAGVRGDRVIMITEGTRDRTPVLSPALGQEDVPTAWGDRESPDPLRGEPEQGGTVGYPIVAVYPGRLAIDFDTVKAEVIGPRGVEPIILRTPRDDDHLTDAVIAIPRRTLAPNAQYQVRIVVTDLGGRRSEQTWTFQTR